LDWTARFEPLIFRLVSLLAIILGVVVMVGWQWALPELIYGGLLGYIPIQFNTAFCFFLLGVAGFLARSSSLRLLAFIPLTIVFIFGFLSFLESFFQFSTFIDQLFFEPPPIEGIFYPGRMAGNTAICFMGTSLSLMLFLVEQPHVVRLTLAAMLSEISFAIAIVALYGYVFSVEWAYGWANLTRMALYTSILFILYNSVLLIWSCTLFTPFCCRESLFGLLHFLALGL
jgi:hypothetical protein